jgi:N utilization substance protein B
LGVSREDWVRDRRLGREAALQMLYQCEVGGVDPDEAISAHGQIEQPARPTSGEAAEFAARLLQGTLTSLGEIDPLIEETSEHWRLSRMAVMDRLVLRLAVYQMLHVADVPPAVAIDESIELATAYGGPESGRFVNGVLDAIRKRLGDEEK